MVGTRENDVGAVVSFDGNGNFVTIKLSNYDRIGQKTNQWVIFGMSGVPAVQLNYAYNLSGELVQSSFDAWENGNWVEKSNRTRTYDNRGHLTNVLENGLKLASYAYTPNGNVKEKTYYDKGTVVMKERVSWDVYGRPTKISYEDANGKELYSTALDFTSVKSNQVKEASHDWKSLSSLGDVSKVYQYGYDYSGRLTSATGDLPGTYKYDYLGRMTNKVEGDTSVNYVYSANSFRPTDFVVTATYMNRNDFLKYDAAGNVWLDKHNFVTYKNNEMGMPTKITKFASVPHGMTLSEVDNAAGELPGAESSVDVAYDESGARVWYSYNDFTGAKGFTEVTIPGVGVYHAEKTGGVNGKFALRRMDLVAGGFRDDGGVARFPMTDAQGNVRGYATTQGIQGAYDYYSYGTVVDLQVDGGADDKRWQDKEFDGEHGKYYFGARYFDPFFALWMSPDPAGQFSNPYTYGGDPVNFVDPNGMMAFGAGIVYGYDSEHGWNVGFGLAAQLGDDGSGPGFNTSFTWSADGSWNANVGGSGALPLAGALELNGGLSYSYNSRSGHALSARAGVCAGSSITACAGAEIGWNLYWNNGSFTGASAYVGLYESALGGLANLSSGYEWGIGSEGRGVYASASVAGATAGMSQNGGFSYGFEGQVYIGATDEGNKLAADGKHREVSRMLWLPSLGSIGRFKFGESYDETNAGINTAGKDAVLAMVEAKEGKKSKFYKNLIDDYRDNDSQLSPKMADRLNNWMLSNGMERVWRLNLLHPEEKRTYRAAGSSAYGNIEIMYGKGYTYSSYNHANNVFDHFFLDMIGYWFSN